MTALFRSRLLLVLFLAAACRREAVPAPPKTTVPPPPVFTEAPDDATERTNLLNIAHGAAVVSRTGEASLETSALSAIDGDLVSAWLSPPNDLEQTLVISLPVRTNVSEVGARLSGMARTGFKTLQIDRSLDGTTFMPLVAMALKETGDEQVATVPPVEASYLRFNVLGPTGNYTQLYSLVARGKPAAVFTPRSLEGCWTVNGMNGSFVQRGSQVYGQIGEIRLEGASDGRTFRLAWSKGPEYGVSLLTLSPDNARLSAIKWHEEALALFIGDNWFGERREPCAGRPEERDDVLSTWLQRAGRFPLYGLFFDDAGALTPASAPAVDRLVRFLGANAGRRFRFRGRGDARQLASLRKALEERRSSLALIEFIGTGGQRRELVTEAMRTMYSTIDLEIRR